MHVSKHCSHRTCLSTESRLHVCARGMSSHASEMLLTADFLHVRGDEVAPLPHTINENGLKMGHRPAVTLVEDAST